jgi:hypothetical protein
MTTKNPFIANLDEIERTLDALSRDDATRVAEWSFNSAAWKILREIKKPESLGGWPVDTGESRKRWGFERVKLESGKVVFAIFNDAPALRGRLKGHAYAGWVYAKGGRPPSRGRPGAPLIAQGIIDRAILATLPTVRKNYRQRLTDYLAKRPKK